MTTKSTKDINIIKFRETYILGNKHFHDYLFMDKRGTTYNRNHFCCLYLEKKKLDVIKISNL